MEGWAEVLALVDSTAAILPLAASLWISLCLCSACLCPFPCQESSAAWVRAHSGPRVVLVETANGMEDPNRPHSIDHSAIDPNCPKSSWVCRASSAWAWWVSCRPTNCSRNGHRRQTFLVPIVHSRDISNSASLPSWRPPVEWLRKNWGPSNDDVPTLHRGIEADEWGE